MAAEHIFILGGARSGKTMLGETLALRLGRNPAYLATAEIRDEEMTARIAAHRAARAGRFETIEEPLELVDALRGAATSHDAVLVDCLTLWLSNLMEAGRDIDTETVRLTEALRTLDTRIILISNETGLGIVPDNALARAFRDHSGRLNQAVAAVATHAYFTAAGLPMVLKGKVPDQIQNEVG